jgi:hypothetical protein
MRIIEKFKNLPRDILNIILNYNGTIKYRKGFYSNIIPKIDDRYKLMEHIINKKIKIFHRSFYYHIFYFE